MSRPIFRHMKLWKTCVVCHLEIAIQTKIINESVSNQIESIENPSNLLNVYIVPLPFEWRCRSRLSIVNAWRSASCTKPPLDSVESNTLEWPHPSFKYLPHVLPLLPPSQSNYHEYRIIAAANSLYSRVSMPVSAYSERTHTHITHMHTHCWQKVMWAMCCFADTQLPGKTKVTVITLKHILYI